MTQLEDSKNTVPSATSQGHTIPDNSSPILGTQMIPMSQLRLSEDYMFRVADDADKIKEYTQYYIESKVDKIDPPFPALLVFDEGDGTYSIYAGRHRFKAAEIAVMTEVLCTIYTDQKLLIKDALASNRVGLPLKLGDKIKSIMIAVEEFPNATSRQIGFMVGCSHTYANEVAKEMREGANKYLTKGADGKLIPKHIERKGTTTKKDKADAKSTKPPVEATAAQQAPQVIPEVETPEAEFIRTDPAYSKLKMALEHPPTNEDERAGWYYLIAQAMIEEGGFQDEGYRVNFLHDLKQDISNEIDRREEAAIMAELAK